MNDILHLPVYADAYKGAVCLLKLKAPGYVTFVSHTGRDILNSLPQTVAGITNPQVQYVDLVNRLQNKWQDEWRGKGLTSSQHDEKSHMIPFDVCELVTKLIKEHEGGRKRSQGKGEFFLNTFLGESDIDRITNLRKWNEARGFFVECAHLREKKFPPETFSKVEYCFKVLEEFLHIAATSAYSRARSLNEILEETNR
ncbi:MAG: hypothetical protein OXG98_18715 [Gemmatimonadetes bacterium]|nr:hypothetical protein [Gemmatimonadota bacterium]